MPTKFKNLKNDLEDLEGSGEFFDHTESDQSPAKGNSKLANYILLIAFLTTLIFYAGSKINFPDITPIGNLVEELNQPDPEIVAQMGEWMEEMGYGTLTNEELIALRSDGVTATYTSEIRELGYMDVTLEQIVEMRRADVSADFTRMMRELGYTLTVEDLIQLRRNDVTAYFTSNMMDLGYTMEELTKENLSRLSSINVSHDLAERLMKENEGVRLTVDELIRYRISNQ